MYLELINERKRQEPGRQEFHPWPKADRNVWNIQEGIHAPNALSFHYTKNRDIMIEASN